MNIYYNSPVHYYAVALGDHSMFQYKLMPPNRKEKSESSYNTYFLR
ncbi:MAG: hypothetical protein GQF41_3361 [Candidatus Rifleibacterium amylolyticum]|nr:MAG: hypothetical protein GQF41_3361 [Candidatus Rifleibacterium amylolyticum]